MPTAKLFTVGRDRVVPLPETCRFDGMTEVAIKRDGDRVILSPTCREASIERLIDALEMFDRFPARAQARKTDRRGSF